MDIEDLKQLVELVSERNIAELVLEEEGVKLKIRKVVAAAAAPVVEPVVSLPAPSASEARPAAGTPVPAPALEPVEDGLLLVKSPIVGTFYRQPEPGAEPFVKQGDPVKKGQVLCIIEAMKLMNEIECEFQGELVKVLVENGQPVQFGDPLFAIRES